MVIKMRLWHQDLIFFLPREQLLGQHRELCALRGKGFDKKHKTVDYVFKYPYYYLYKFHLIVIKEMEKRGYNVNPRWKIRNYRGKNIGFDYTEFTQDKICGDKIYKEHDEKYLIECIENLNKKNKRLLTDKFY